MDVYFRKLEKINRNKKVKFEPGMVAHICNPSSWKVGTGGSED